MPLQKSLLKSPAQERIVTLSGQVSSYKMFTLCQKDEHNVVMHWPKTEIEHSFISFPPLFCLQGGVEGGALTSVGRQQAYDLGQKFRKKYVEKHGLINQTFLSKET